MHASPLLRGLIFLILLGGFTAQAASEFRPAVLAPGRSSLVNLIDTKALMKHGQGSGMVMFTAVIATRGDTRRYFTRVYGGTPGTEVLTKELIGKIDRAIFHPALYRGTPQDAMISGTVVFAVAEGKPHLRVYLNQEKEDLKKDNDFIAPQLIFLPGTWFNKEGLRYPAKANGQAGTVAVRLDIGLDGKVNGQKLLYEAPKGMDFGGQVMMDIKEATFLPGYRNGKPVSCSFTLSVIYRGVGNNQWQSD